MRLPDRFRQICQAGQLLLLLLALPPGRALAQSPSSVLFTNIARSNYAPAVPSAAFVASGYLLGIHPRTDAPVISDNAALDKGLRDEFGLPGLIGQDITAATDSSGNIYAAGSFTHTANNHLVRWDGERWHTVAAGLYGDISAIVVRGSTIYLGGSFTIEGDTSIHNIAKWNGTKWSNLGTGTDSGINTLAVQGDTVYAGGYFFKAGGMPALRVARWDGRRWSGLGTGLNGAASAIAVCGNTVYAGGNFTQAGGQPANYVAKWDGIKWTGLGKGVNEPVFRLAVMGDTVCVAGDFTKAGRVKANQLAQWNGKKWSSPAQAVEGDIYALATSSHTVYVEGYLLSKGRGAEGTARFGVYRVTFSGKRARAKR